MQENFLDNNNSSVTEEISFRIFDLIIGRVLQEMHSDLNENEQAKMEEIFNAEDKTKQQEFIEKNMPKFKKFFVRELEKVQQEIILEVKKELEVV